MSFDGAFELSDTQSNQRGINPQHPKDALDGLIEVGWEISGWNINYRDEILTIKFNNPQFIKSPRQVTKRRSG